MIQQTCEKPCLWEPSPLLYSNIYFYFLNIWISKRLYIQIFIPTALFPGKLAGLQVVLGFDEVKMNMMSVTRTFIMITLMILKLSMVIRMINLMIIMVLIIKIIRVIYMKVCQFQCCPYCDTQLTHQPSKPRPPPTPVKPPRLHRFTFTVKPRWWHFWSSKMCLGKTN